MLSLENSLGIQNSLQKSVSAIYVATIPRNNERINFLKKHLSGLDLIIKYGKDGKQLTTAEISEVYNGSIYNEKKRRLSTGEIGCLLTHKMILEEIANKSSGRYLVLEDDAEINADCAPNFDIANTLFKAKSAEIIYLGTDCLKKSYLFKEIIRKILCFRNKEKYMYRYDVQISKYLYRAGAHSMAHAIIYTPKGAKKILYNMNVLNTPFDDIIENSVRSGEIRAYLIYPFIFNQRSQISKYMKKSVKSSIWDE